MNIRGSGKFWYHQRVGQIAPNLHCSKIYLPEKSWTKQRAWWFEIPVKKILGTEYSNIDLLCEVECSVAKDFLFIRVPREWLLSHLNKLVQRNGNFVLWLSAEQGNFLEEVRSETHLSFRNFLQEVTWKNNPADNFTC